MPSGRMGGIVGDLSATGQMNDCINKGDITATSNDANQVGGVSGSASGSVTRCANYGDVTGKARNLGGLTGQATVTTAVFTDCYNAGTVTYSNGTNALDSAGGLIGFGSVYQMINCHQYGTVKKQGDSGSTHVGSVIGRHVANSKSKISQVYVREGANENDFVMDAKTLDELKSASGEFFASLYEADEETFANVSGVLVGINGNNSFVLTNQTYPEFTTIVGTHIHSGGTATCVDQAVCEICGLKYGELDPTNHVETELRNQKDAVWVYDGNTGDTYCIGCNTLLEKGEVIPADISREVVTFTVKESGQEDQVKTYTAAEFDALKTTGQPIGYMFGFKTNTIMAATEYVTLEDVMKDLGASYSALDQIKVVCSGSTSVISGDDLRACKWYYDEDGNQYAAPASFAMTYSSQTGTLEKVAAVAQSSDDYTNGSSDLGNKVVSYNGTLISDDMAFEGNADLTVNADQACVVAIENADGTFTRLQCSEQDGKYVFTVPVADIDVHLIVAKKGDVDLSGSVNGKDSSIVKKAAVNKYTLNVLQELAGDVDASGTVNGKDRTMISKMTVGKIIASWDIQN